MRVWSRKILRPVALALVMTVGACAAPSAPPVLAKPTAAGASSASFDGTYSGESLPDQVIEGCGERGRAITIEVRGDRAWTHHSRPSLTGTIDATGQVSMQNSDGTSSLTGLIQSAVLTGTETTSDAPKKLQGFYATTQSTCTLQIQATRDPGDSD
jgi:hypothetical protein